ncbi:MAG TPA: hypothetical protein VHV10_13930 [Ktedonobacteraceae bacterium]|nr:hypothetical protein [Ktedonobacteraceae bacterium]
MPINGKAVAAISVGGLFVYAGLRGYSILKAVQNVIQGKSPQDGQTSSILSNEPSSSGNSGGTGSTATPTTSEKTWWSQMLEQMRAPATGANITSLTSWRQKECSWNSSPPDGALYTNNPLNTTENASGAVSINSVGVKKYPNQTVGMQATINVLHNGLYPEIVAALMSGKGLCGVAPDEFLKWSGNGYSRIC